MPRSTSGAATHRKKVRMFRQTKGYRGPRKNRYRLAKEAVLRAGVNAFRDRRRRKREFRSLWITRLTAVCRQEGLRYSTFIHGCMLANIALNRKLLSEMAIHDPAALGVIFGLVREALKNKQVA
ncbi:MAG: 50S ribosomal protein L20 [Phycisphaerae bacterium]|nr:50S ribosomal protein L20 [Phycisphaerae bacterium]